MRARGIPTEVAATAQKFGKQIRYAERRGIPFVWFPGEPHEVKDIRSGHQEPAERLPVASPVPVLLLSGAYDPVTPPDWGDRAAATLPKSRHLVFRAASHIVTSGEDCAMAAAVTFVEQETVPATVCPGAGKPPVFEVP